MPPVDLQNDMDYLNAKDALEHCAKAVLAGKQQGPLILAMKKVDIVWDHAPKNKMLGKRRPQSSAELRAYFSEPCEVWMPYAHELGGQGQSLLDERNTPTQYCKLMA